MRSALPLTFWKNYELRIALVVLSKRGRSTSYVILNQSVYSFTFQTVLFFTFYSFTLLNRPFYFFTLLFFTFKTSLVCTQKKPCLDSKSLVCDANKASLISGN